MYHSPSAEREAFIRAKYVQHAFVHPHPNFERPEIPPPQPKFTQLLTPSKNPLPPKASPQQKRSYSPSLKFKSPKLPRAKLHRPSSLAGGLDLATSSSSNRYSDDDRFGGSERPSSMMLLAENLTKLEKSGKLKSWEKIKGGARRASLRFSLGRFGSSSPTGLMNRKRSKQEKKERALFESHSDLEDDDDSFESSSTPLLHSVSANNLAPPKPPRTFKTKVLDMDTDDSLLEGGEGKKLSQDENSEFAEVLLAIKKMGTLYSETEVETKRVEDRENDTKHEKIVANGRVPMGTLVENASEDITVSTPSNDTQGSNHIDSDSKLAEREGSRVVHRDETTGEVTEELPGVSELDTVRESARTEVDEGLIQQATSNTSEGTERRVSGSENDSTEVGKKTPAKEDEVQQESVKSSVVFREKKVAVSAYQTLSPPYTCSINGEEDRSSSEIKVLFDDKRFSILSCASTEWFSADSSTGDSKPNSTSISPEVPDSVSPPSQVGDSIRIRFHSSDDECFSTPPSTPNPPLETPVEDHVTSKSELTNETAVEDHVTSLPELTDKTPVEDHVTSMPEVTNETPIENHVTSMPELTNETAVEDHVTSMPELTDKTPVEDHATSMPELTNEMAVEDHVTSMPELTNQVLDDNEAEDSKSQKVDSDVTCETTTNQIADASHDHVTQPHVSKRETQTPNKKRNRSLTVSSAPVSDLRGKLFPSSRDDNFGTEFSQRHYTDGDASSFGMVSSFSEQDFADIFKASIPVLNIETVEEQDGDDDAIEGPAEDEKQASQRSSVEDLNDGDNSSFGEDVYKPGTPSSLESRVETPESIEPVVIPDNITPDKVSIMMSTIKNDVYLVSKCTVKQ